MNISHYIQELLFTKQKVVLPYIGSFEMVSKPAHINGATGTITPPSKTIKFSHNEGTDYSTLVNHVAKRNGISPAKALKQICIFAEELNNRMHNGEEAEIEGVGILRIIGSGTVIFLPFSSYSNLGESFGLPTISIAKKGKIEQVEDSDAIEEQALENQPEQEKISETLERLESKKEVLEEEPFELIDDFVEESSTDQTISQPATATEQKQETKEAEEVKVEKQEPATPEVKEQPILKEKKEEPIAAAIPTKEEQLAEKTHPEDIKAEQPPLFLKKESLQEKVNLSSIENNETKKEVPLRRNSASWIWPTLVIVCILAIGLVALYHYNPKLFGFILPDSNNEMVIEPTVPSDVDSSYYKTLTSAAADTSSAIDDSTRIDSARANLQKIDSTSKKPSATKTTAKAPNLSAKKPMTKEEMENLINEKLKLGSAAAKTNDTQQRVIANKQIPEAKTQVKPTTGAYHVIAASVANMEEAKKVSESLKSKGYAPLIMENGKGRIRISIGSYPTSRQAVNAANAAKRKVGINAWILNP